MTDDTTPTLIGGRYQTVRPIGRGGMGTVWLARDTVLGREVAAKQIGDFPGESEGETRRAMREARAAAALNHPSVVAVYDVTEHEGTPWLVMEYVAGPTLASAIRERGPMTPKGAADLGAQLAGALAAAHRAGIVHRDIKPANVLIGGGRPKIGDFGIARAGPEDNLTQTGMVTGTPSYMAPEVAVGQEHGEAADVWALGATIYFAVEGRDAHPSQGNALATLRHIATHPPRRPQRAGALEPVLADMLARDPARRGTMSQVLRRLDNIAAGGAEAPRTTPAAPAAHPQPGPAGPIPQRSTKGRSPLPWVAAGAVLVLLLIAAIVFAMSRGGDSPASSGSETTGSDTSASETTASETTASETTASETTASETTASETTASEEPEPTTETTTTTTTESDDAQEQAFTEDEGRDFIENYFATVTRDQDAGWEMLAPSLQTDRDSYDGFWSGIESVDTEDVSVDAAAGTVTVNVTYHPEDRAASTEEQTYALTRIDGDLKIEDDNP